MSRDPERSSEPDDYEPRATSRCFEPPADYDKYAERELQRQIDEAYSAQIKEELFAAAAPEQIRKREEIDDSKDRVADMRAA